MKEKKRRKKNKDFQFKIYVDENGKWHPLQNMNETAENTMPEQDVPDQKTQLAVRTLDLFTKIWCIKQNNEFGIVFECNECQFYGLDGTCKMKQFKNAHFKQYKEFGSMGDL